MLTTDISNWFKARRAGAYMLISKAVREGILQLAEENVHLEVV